MSDLGEGWGEEVGRLRGRCTIGVALWLFCDAGESIKPDLQRAAGDHTGSVRGGAPAELRSLQNPSRMPRHHDDYILSGATSNRRGTFYTSQTLQHRLSKFVQQSLAGNQVCVALSALSCSPDVEQGVVGRAARGLQGIWLQQALLGQQGYLGAEHGVHGVAVQPLVCKPPSCMSAWGAGGQHMLCSLLAHLLKGGLHAVISKSVDALSRTLPCLQAQPSCCAAAAGIHVFQAQMLIAHRCSISLPRASLSGLSTPKHISSQYMTFAAYLGRHEMGSRTAEQ